MGLMFSNRTQAAKSLAKTPELKKLAAFPDAVVLGIPRGGVVTAAELARELHLPLGSIVTRKITTPENPEFALGAVGESGEAVWNEAGAGLFSDRDRKAMEQEARKEAARRNVVFHGNREPDLIGKTAILVDDGLATGMTMLSAVNEARGKAAKQVIVAVPVAPSETVEKIRAIADEVVVLDIPIYFAAVGQFYREFPQISDEEVTKILSGVK